MVRLRPSLGVVSRVFCSPVREKENVAGAYRKPAALPANVNLSPAAEPLQTE
jgi:hypothetical protein